MSKADEIEKAKEVLNKLKDYKVLSSSNFQELLTEEEKDAIETLLQYIDQLEQENNKQNKIIDEMVEFIVSSVIAEDTVCSRIFCNKKGNCSYKKQKKCTKQYFEKKVEEK